MLLLPSSLLCYVCAYGVCCTAAPSGAVLCGAMGYEVVVRFIPPSCQVLEPPPPAVQWHSACWLVAYGFLGLVGSWAVEFGPLAGWLVGWFVGWLMCG